MPTTQFSLVLCRTQGPINLGLCARLCGNLGIEDLRLVNPLCGRDDDDARRFANHRRDFLASVPLYDDLPSAVADRQLVVATTARVRDERFGCAVTLEQLPGLIQQRQATRVALVFGNEAHGLDSDELAQCHLHLHLDTPGDYSSYNLATAVAIVGHHLCALPAATAAPAPAAEETSPAADHALQRRLEEYWLDSLDRFQYFRGNRRRDIFAPHFRQLINRLDLSKDDATTLFACLAQFNYYAFGDKGPQGSVSDNTPPPPQD